MAAPIIETPRGRVFHVQTKNGKVSTRLTWNPDFRPKWQGRYSAAQRFVDSEVLRKSNLYIPVDTSMLAKSGILGTDIGSGEVAWIAPYAHYQYYLENRKTSLNRNPLGGPRWFDRAMVTHKNAIVRGAGRIAGGKVTFAPRVK